MEETCQAEGRHVQSPGAEERWYKCVATGAQSEEFSLYPKSEEEFLRLFKF